MRRHRSEDDVHASPIGNMNTNNNNDNNNHHHSVNSNNSNADQHQFSGSQMGSGPGAGPRLETFDMTTFNPMMPESWAALALAWKGTTGREPGQMELMGFLAGQGPVMPMGMGMGMGMGMMHMHPLAHAHGSMLSHYRMHPAPPNFAWPPQDAGKVPRFKPSKEQLAVLVESYNRNQ